MPRIPTRGDQRGSLSPTPVRTAGALASVARSMGNAVAGVEGALNRMGAQNRAQQEERSNRLRQREVLAAQTAMVEGIADAQTRANEASTPEEVQSIYDELGESSTQWGQGILDQDLRVEFEERAMRSIATQGVAFGRLGQKLEDQIAGANLENTLVGIDQTLSETTDPAQRADLLGQATEAIFMAGEAQNKPDEVIEGEIREMRREMARNDAIRRLEADPHELLQGLEDGDDDPTLRYLEEGTRAKALEEAQKAIDELGAAARAERFVDFHQRAHYAPITEADLPALREDLAAGFEDGVVSQSQYASLLGAATGRTRKDVEETRWTEALLARWRGEGGPPIDMGTPEAKKAVDALYLEVLEPMWSDALEAAADPMAGPEEEQKLATIEGSLVDFIVDTQAYPSSLVGQMRDGLRSNDPDTLASVLGIWAKVDAMPNGASINGNVFPEGSKEHAFATTMWHRLSAGASATDAAETARQMMEVPKEVRSERIRASQKTGPEALDQEIAERIDTDRTFFFFGTDRVMPDAMRAEMLRSRRIYSSLGLSDEEAAEAAVRDAMGKWQESAVGVGDGDAHWRYRSPEQVYGISGLSRAQNADWMNAQLLEEARAASGNPALSLGDVRIVEDKLTALEAMPAYTVLTIDEDGRYEPIMTDEGKPYRMFFQYQAAPGAEPTVNSAIQGELESFDARRAEAERQDRILDSARPIGQRRFE